MNFSEAFISYARKILPSPFTIAVLLTLITAALVFIIRPVPPVAKPKYEISIGGTTKSITKEEYQELAWKYEIPPANVKRLPKPLFLSLLQWWEKGFWELLEFAMQMVLILVLGHALALTPFFSRIISRIVSLCTNTAQSAAIVAFAAMTVALFNWGLGLIFGAILARKVAEHASKNNMRLNYPLIGAAGYAGLMVWHGGFSGSAPLKVAEANHFLVGQAGVIPIDLTILSSMNITANIALLIIVPIVLYVIGSKANNSLAPVTDVLNSSETSNKDQKRAGAEKLDHSRVLAYLFSLAILGTGVYKALSLKSESVFSFISLNYVNFILLGLGILLHGSFARYIKAIDEAVGGAAGIIIQFPIYAGIMGIMKYSGLIHSFADFFVQISNATTLPLFTFASASVVNCFVPSGGGQWAVQGPIVVQSALEIGTALPKNIMALVYGDQLTNMIQPFWALPLLGITGLDAKDILPYSFVVMLAGVIVFAGVLLIF